MIIKTTQRHLLSCLLSLIFLPNMVAVIWDHFQGCLLARAEAESADLVIFKDHFTLPTFKRPPEQLWMIYLLGKTSSWFHNYPHQHHHVGQTYRVPPPHPNLQAERHFQLDCHLQGGQHHCGSLWKVFSKSLHDWCIQVNGYTNDIVLL